MSSRNKEKASKSSRSRASFPSSWSAWEWNTEYKCDVRCRLESPGNYKYEYRPSPEASVPRTTTTSQDSTGGQYPSYDNYTATPSDPTIGITRGLDQTSLKSTAIQQQPIPQSLPAPTSQGNRGSITTRDDSTNEETFDPNYKVHGGWEFKWGRVFKILWAEPGGNDGGSNTESDNQYSMRKDRFGQKVFQKVRRFVIVSPRDGHCMCLPIMTYSEKGVLKKGVHAKDHTIIYTDKPVAYPGEEKKGLQKKPIRVKPAGPRHKLDEASRLNYAKLYTVEYNVKVWFVGKIHSDSEKQLIADYNLVHPPLTSRGPAPTGTLEPVYESTRGAAVPYQTQGSSTGYNIPAEGNMSSNYPGYSGAASEHQQRQAAAPYASANYNVATTPHSNVQVAPYPAAPSSYQPTGYSNPSDPFYQSQSGDLPPNLYHRERYYD